MSTLHEDACTFMTISRSILVKLGNVSEKKNRENKHMQIVIVFVPCT